MQCNSPFLVDTIEDGKQIIENGGFSTGGFNFDAKLRRQSVDPNDLYLAHIAGIDTLARALLGAADVLHGKQLARLREERYKGWNSELGRRIDAGEYRLSSLADHALQRDFDPKPQSSRQELAESLIANCSTH